MRNLLPLSLPPGKPSAPSPQSHLPPTTITGPTQTTMLVFAIIPVFILALSCLSQALPDVTKDIIKVSAQDAPDGRPISGIVSMANGYEGSYFCETTHGSPWSGDVFRCAEKLSGLGETRCVQTERYGSFCNRVMEIDS